MSLTDTTQSWRISKLSDNFEDLKMVETAGTEPSGGRGSRISVHLKGGGGVG